MAKHNRMDQLTKKDTFLDIYGSLKKKKMTVNINMNGMKQGRVLNFF